MAKRVLTLILLAWLSVALAPAPAAAALFDPSSTSAFVPADRAFGFDFQQQGAALRLSWQIRPGYYLYRQQLKLEPVNAILGEPPLPPGTAHHDAFFGETQVYRTPLQVDVPLRQAREGAILRVTYQGCAEAGFCYPPETREIPLSAVTPASAVVPADTIKIGAARPVSGRLPFTPLWALLIGIGIAFTPCVLPMYPLIASIILGGSARALSTGRVLALALVYVQGMAITYTLLGMAVAAAGLQFQAALQQPAVLIGLSALFILLSLSMFGLFTLQLPSTLQTRLTLWSNQQRGGSLPGVFIMGALAGLFCSPCTTAPLSAILLYIAQSGNLAVGGVTLYLYALGMGIPLVAAALFGHRLLPRGGPWMQRVKEGFGFVILALPVFLLERILGDTWALRLWSLLAVAFLGWAFLLSLTGTYRGGRLVQMILLASLLVVARPLQDWAFAPSAGAAPGAIAQGPVFIPITGVQDIGAALSRTPDKLVMLDLYADWCVACKEFEKYTFTAESVKQNLGKLTLLQANVTDNSPAQQALLSQLRVMGLPTILFFDRQGQEIPDSRVTGFMNADEFDRHLQKVIRYSPPKDRP